MNLCAKDYLGQILTVIVDRPMGSRHPEWGHVYPVNYGYIPGRLAPDGELQDAYVLGIDVPLEAFTGRCIAIVHRLNDVEDKLIVVPEGGPLLTREEIMLQVDFQERYFETILVMDSQSWCSS